MRKLPLITLTAGTVTMLAGIASSFQSTQIHDGQTAQTVQYLEVQEPIIYRNVDAQNTDGGLDFEVMSGTPALDHKQCPLSFDDAHIIVDFTDNGASSTSELMLRADASHDEAIHERTTFILPGTYRVESVSYVNTEIEETQSLVQDRRWYAEFLDENNVLVGKTQATRGTLPGEVAHEILIDSLAVSGGVYTIRIHHNAYPSDEPHAVTPLCLALVTVPDAIEGVRHAQ